MGFVKATKRQSKLRAAFVGIAGSGKTYSALAIGTKLGVRVALIDTERGSASKYAGKFDFDVLELEVFAPEHYVKAIHEAEAAGYDVVIIDSLSHAWTGIGGALEMKDKASMRQGENSFTAWRHVTPEHNKLVEAMLQCRAHLLVTMRQKTEYVIEENERGKKTPRKIGMKPEQRDGLDYEFDLVGSINQDHAFVIEKSRLDEYAPVGDVIVKPGEQLANRIKAWLEDGAPPVVRASPLDELRVALAAATTKATLAELKPRAAGTGAEGVAAYNARFAELKAAAEKQLAGPANGTSGSAGAEPATHPANEIVP